LPSGRQIAYPNPKSCRPTPISTLRLDGSRPGRDVGRLCERGYRPPVPHPARGIRAFHHVFLDPVASLDCLARQSQPNGPPCPSTAPLPDSGSRPFQGRARLKQRYFYGPGDLWFFFLMVFSPRATVTRSRPSGPPPRQALPLQKIARRVYDNGSFSEHGQQPFRFSTGST